MDTVVANKYNDILSSLNIEVSKKLEGEFTVDEIISAFGNYFFSRMFLDITAVSDYKNLTNLQKLVSGINADKIILLLDKDDQISNSNSFLSKLVSMGIYNFTKDSNNLMYLYENPNDYGDVVYLQDINREESVAIPENSIITSSNNAVSQVPSRKILGIKNVTDGAGATTLIYLLKKILSDYYSVMALEIDKRDFTFLNSNDMLSIKEDEINDTISKYSTVNIFLIDLNKSKREDICTEVLYLVEPSTIKLNKTVLIDRNIFNTLKYEKVVLNKVKLSNNDITDFELESGVKVFYNLPPLNDKEDCSRILLPLLEKLGYIKEDDSSEGEEEPKNNFFKLFK